MNDQNSAGLGGPLKKPAAPTKGLSGKPLAGKPLGEAAPAPASASAAPAAPSVPAQPMQFELDDGGGKSAAKAAAKQPAKDPTPATFNPFSDQKVSVPVGGGAPAAETEPPARAAPGTGRVTKKPASDKPAAPAEEAGDGDIAPGLAKDLWTCPHCGAKNKPARTTCRGCDKSPDDEVEIPWFKKPPILGGIAGGVVLLVILVSLMGGTDLTLHPAGPGHLDSKVRIGKAAQSEIDLGDNHKFFVKKSVSVSGRILLAQSFPFSGKLTAVVLALGSQASDDSTFEGWKAEFKDESYVVSGAPRTVTLFLIGGGKTDLQRGGYLSVRGDAGVIENDARIVDGTTGSTSYVIKVAEKDQR